MLVRAMLIFDGPFGHGALKLTTAVTFVRVFDVGRSQIVGASLGVLAAHSAGESNQTLRQLIYLPIFTVGAAAAMTAVIYWLAGDVLKQASLCNSLNLEAFCFFRPITSSFAV